MGGCSNVALTSSFSFPCHLENLSPSLSPSFYHFPLRALLAPVGLILLFLGVSHFVVGTIGAFITSYL